ncbi:MAG: hypothetical protein AB1538_06295, partial [Bacillota bacterium]
LKAFSYLKTSKNWLQGCWLGFTLVGLTPTRLSDLTRPHYTKSCTYPTSPTGNYAFHPNSFDVHYVIRQMVIRYVY